jgi:hypothetical protein
MRSIPFALTWELLYCGRWTLLLGFVGGMALPVILLTSLRIAMIDQHNVHDHAAWGSVRPFSADSVQKGKYPEIGDPGLADKELEYQLSLVQLVLIQTNIFCFGAGVVSSLRSVKRLYPFPMSTTAIATSQLLLGMALMAAESFLGIAFLNALFGIHWPLWGPALFAAVAFASIQSMIWQTNNTGWLIIGIGAVSAVLGSWLNARYSIFTPPCRPWGAITPLEVATLLIFGAIAFYSAIRAVARNRRGDQLRSLGILAWIERMSDLPAAVGPDFKSRLAAQEWFDWRSKGWPMPVSTVVVLLFGVVSWLVNSRDPKLLLAGCLAGGFLLSAVAMVPALISGNLGAKDGSFDMGHFLATRPITSTELAHSLLTTAMKSIAFAWTIWLCALLFVFGTLLSTGTITSFDTIHEWLGDQRRDALWFHVENGKAQVRWTFLPLTLLGPWIVVSFGMAVGSTGRIKAFAALFFSGLLLFVAGTQLAQFALSDKARILVAESCLMAGGGILMLGSAIVSAVAHRRSLLSRTSAYASIAIFAALSSLTLVKWDQHVPPIPLASNIFAVGLAALVVVPFSAVPLGISMNRTR